MAIVESLIVADDAANKIVDENEGRNEEVNEKGGGGAIDGEVSVLEEWYEDIDNYDPAMDYGINEAECSCRDLPAQTMAGGGVNIEVPTKGALVITEDPIEGAPANTGGLILGDPMVEGIALVNIGAAHGSSRDESIAIFP